ncbi:MAG TPA: sugar phosphate nucleotidyltransferase [Gaiellaceae bacterium]|nr:sugar phosphate nucleotidyltransferase [Gaiellaceae bacterium]
MILAGGLGTRLRPYTTILPKPLVPVGGRPILEHILLRLYACGVREVDLCVGHLGELIQVYFTQADALPDDLELRWHWEDEPLGTAGAMRIVPGLGGTFIAMNGDILTTLDFRELVAFHEQAGAALTVATHAKRVDVELGVIDTNGDRITGFREKPQLHYEASMGIYVYDERALAHLPAEGPCQFPDLIQRLLAEGETIAAFRSDAEWFDIGTVPEHQRAVEAFEQHPEVFAT